jgi:thioredoxin reductase (NADPH)
MENVIIIGTGCAGWTAAIYTARANLRPLVLSGVQPGGQLTTTTEVENFPGFPEGVMGPDLMMQMQRQAEKFGTRVEYTQVDSLVKNDDGTFTLKSSEDGLPRPHRDRRHRREPAPPRPAERKSSLIGHGLTSCATCDGAFYRDVPVCVIGGGDSACEEAIFLTRFASKVYLIHRRESCAPRKSWPTACWPIRRSSRSGTAPVSEYLTDERGEMRAVR